MKKYEIFIFPKEGYASLVYWLNDKATYGWRYVKAMDSPKDTEWHVLMEKDA